MGAGNRSADARVAFERDSLPFKGPFEGPGRVERGHEVLKAEFAFPPGAFAEASHAHGERLQRLDESTPLIG